MKNIYKYIILLVINFIFSTVSIFTRFAAEFEFLSIQYLCMLIVAIFILGLYALSWQQIIKRMPISEAYMFKGTSIIFVLLLSAMLFSELITWCNIIGAIIIIVGIAIFANADKEAKS